MSETRVLEFRDAPARYETFDVLHEISLEVYAGEFVSIIGPNGAGKTTVLRVVSGFLHPHAGSVVMNGRLGRRLAAGENWPRAGRVRSAGPSALCPSFRA